MRLSNKWWVGFLWLALMVTSFGAGTATVAAEQPRPKIGLALGGGGALGFTHIGVLKWLEEHRIPVDRVAGTSMGGLLGGFYAMGMSPQEIESLVKSVNWDQLFSSDPPYNLLKFRRKEDQRNYPSQLKLGGKGGLVIPNGLSVYQVYFLLSRVALPYSSVQSFNELPIPYCCVATDIRNSDEVILKDGSLPQALRATMSLPAIFTPVEREGRLLVDGGVVNNVPADVVKAMGADIVIAIDCNESNGDKDLRSLDALLLSTVNTVIVNNTRQALMAADLTVHPQVTGATAFDWKDAEKLITAGYRAIASQAERFKKLALDEPQWQQYLRQRAARQRLGPVIPQDVVIEGTNAINESNIRELLKPLIGKPLDTAVLETRLSEVLGTGLFASIRYEMQQRDQSQLLLVTVAEKSYGPPFIGFGIRVNAGSNWVDSNLLIRGTAFNVWGDDSELRTDLALGNSPSCGVELYRPFGNNGWFLAPQGGAELQNGSYFRETSRTTDFKVRRQRVGLDLGYGTGRFWELRAGYEGWHQSLNTVVGESMPNMEGYGQKVELKYSYSKAESKNLFGPGVNWRIQANRYLTAPETATGFTTLETQFRWVGGVGNHHRLLVKAAAGATLDGKCPFLQQYSLGGPFQLGAYQIDELRDANYCLGLLGYLKPMGQEVMGNQVYLGAVLEGGGVFADWANPQAEVNLSLGLAANTPVGVAWLGASFGEVGERIYLTLGRGF